MIDKTHIGYAPDPVTMDIEKGRLKFFARSTGQEDPIYLDEDAAKAVGFRALPAPPTFLFSIDLEQEAPMAFLDLLGVDVGRILHGEQEFTYFQPICAGDTITLKSRIEDIYDKKNGAMEFVVQKFSSTNQLGEHVADMTRTIVVRN